ncbi:MAG: M20 metallopeptidase family protein [bacterium]|jgi:amidohydrolase
MKTLLHLFLITALIAVSQFASASELQDKVESLTQEIMPKVIEWRRDFHAHPELSNREERTGRVVAEHLREMGIENLQTGVAHHGVVALIEGGKPGPVVALRADMDALPVTEETGLPFASQNEGVMHACGHDAHTAMLLGAAYVLQNLKDEIPGTVKLIFQPAEEGPPAGEEGGAKMMTKLGVLDNPKVEAIFGQHISTILDAGTIGYTPEGTMAAVDQLKITITGKQTHAAYPWEGIDPVVTAAHIITAAQTLVSRNLDIRKTAVLSLGKINGGTRWNIIPDDVTIEGTIRTHDTDVRKMMLENLKRVITNTAESFGATAQLEVVDYGPVTYNNPKLVEKMLPTLKKVAGEAKVSLEKPSMGGEDFAYFAEKVPGFYFHLGVRNEETGAVNMVHTPKMIIDESALPLGVKAITMMALDYLSNEN